MFRKKEKQKQRDKGKDTERNKNVFSDSCAKHPNRTLDSYCSICNDVYCRDCRDTGSHKFYKHHKLEYISTAAYMFEDSEEFKDFDKNILALRRKLERSIEKTTENMKLSTQLQDEAENEIRQQKEILIEKIETHYHDISERNKKKNEDCLTRLKEVIQQTNRLNAQFEDIENKINKKRKSLMTSLFIAIKRSEKEIERIKEELGELNKNNDVTRYVFEAGEQTDSFMKTTEDFGSLVDEILNSERYSSERRYAVPSVDSMDSTSDDNDGGYLKPKSTGSAISMTDQEQFSSSSKESLNSSSASSGAVAKYKPVRDPSPQDFIALEHEQTIDNTEYLERKPTSGPKSSPLFYSQFDLSGLDEKKVRDPSPQDFSVPDHEQTIDSTGPQSETYSSGKRIPPAVPPKPGPKPPTQTIRQAKRGHSLTDRGLSGRTQQAPDKYKVLYPYTTHDEEYLSIKKGDIVTVLEKCSGDFFWAELNGHCGYIRKDYLEKVVGTGSNANVLSELEAKLRARYSAT